MTNSPTNHSLISKNGIFLWPFWSTLKLSNQILSRSSYSASFLILYFSNFSKQVLKHIVSSLSSILSSISIGWIKLRKSSPTALRWLRISLVHQFCSSLLTIIQQPESTLDCWKPFSQKLWTQKNKVIASMWKWPTFYSSSSIKSLKLIMKLWISSRTCPTCFWRSIFKTWKAYHIRMLKWNCIICLMYTFYTYLFVSRKALPNKMLSTLF
jgi:hypothetical protein